MAIALWDSQIQHANRLIDILRDNVHAIDLSTMGSGKTYVAAWVALQLGLPLLVFCPANVRDVWRTVLNHQNDDLEGNKARAVDICSYTKMSNQNSKYVKAKRGETRIEYYPTDHLKELVEKGVLIVCDEAQCLKNDSGRNRVFSAIAETVQADTRPITRILFLSATLIDKAETQFRHTFRALGYGVDLKEIGERLCPQVDIGELRRKHNESGKKKAGCYEEIFLNEIRDKCSSTMPKENIPYKNSIKNFEVPIPPRLAAQFAGAMGQIQDAMIEGGADMLGCIFKAIIKAQEAKVAGTVRYAEQCLERIPNSKVIIMAGYHSVVDEIYDKLDAYNRCKYTGMVSQANRAATLKTFQEPNDKLRVFVGTYNVASKGISLHDTDGRFPRILLLMANYYAMDSQQATGRAYRGGVKSNTFTRIIYGRMPRGNLQTNRIIQTEQAIMQSLHMKGDCMKTVMNKQAEDGVEFFCDLTKQERASGIIEEYKAGKIQEMVLKQRAKEVREMVRQQEQAAARGENVRQQVQHPERCQQEGPADQQNEELPEE